MTRFRVEFNQLDRDGSGTLSLQEVQALGSPVQAEAFADLYYASLSLRVPTDASVESGDVPEMTYGEYLAAAICGRLNVSTDRAALAFSTLEGGEYRFVM